MNSVSLLEAWRTWFSGQSVSDIVLWGMPILWWGRLGKLVSLLSALTIVAEIVGPDRMRAFGESLHGKLTLRELLTHIKRGFRWFAIMWKDLCSLPGSDSARRRRAEANEFGADNLNFLVILVTVIIGSIIVWSRFSWWQVLLGALFAFFFGIYTFGPILTILLVVGSMSLFALSDLLVIEPIAWVLERPRLDRWIKICAVVLLMVGFHFDFLAS